MILLVDADSLVFASCYKKRETPDDERYFSDIADARNKFDEQYMAIVNRLEEIYNIEKVITFRHAYIEWLKIGWIMLEIV